MATEICQKWRAVDRTANTISAMLKSQGTAKSYNKGNKRQDLMKRAWPSLRSVSRFSHGTWVSIITQSSAIKILNFLTLVCKRTVKKKTSKPIVIDITTIAVVSMDGGFLKFDITPTGGGIRGMVCGSTPGGRLVMSRLFRSSLFLDPDWNNVQESNEMEVGKDYTRQS